MEVAPDHDTSAALDEGIGLDMRCSVNEELPRIAGNLEEVASLWHEMKMDPVTAQPLQTNLGQKRGPFGAENVCVQQQQARDEKT